MNHLNQESTAYSEKAVQPGGEWLHTITHTCIYAYSIHACMHAHTWQTHAAAQCSLSTGMSLLVEAFKNALVLFLRV